MEEKECGNLTRPSQETLNTCTFCQEARLLLVTGASYADCDGVYSLTNLTSVWDSKHIVYSRLASLAHTTGDNRLVELGVTTV